MAFLESFLPPQTSDFFFDNILEISTVGKPKGVLSSVFLLSILLMANGVNAVFTGFEISYHEQLSRNFFKQYLYALGVALLLAFLLVITVAFWGYFEIYVIQNIHEQLELRGLLPQNRNYSGQSRYLFFVLIVCGYCDPVLLWTRRQGFAVFLGRCFIDDHSYYSYVLFVWGIH